MKQRGKNGSGVAYSPNMETPARRKNNRGPLALLLIVLLPPIGLVYMWRESVFRARGRMLLTSLATVEMALLMFAIMPTSQLRTEMPVPIAPASVTLAPDDGVVSALSNLDQLLAQRQAERDAAAGITPTPQATNDAEWLAEQEAILHTIVYSVYGNGARFYHKDTVCGTQSNRRALTVEEAMGEYMGACPDCNPPVYLGP